MKLTIRGRLCPACFLTIATLAWLLVPAVSGAQDSEAPRGASVRWLPCERWVMMHWLPYHERHLFRMLRISPAEARRWIADDQHHTFAQLVRRRGLAPKTVARRLVTAWAREFGKARRARLQERALRSLTQGHLSQHVLFHVFHHPEVGARAPRVFKTSPMHYLRLRRSGYTPAEIGALGGRSREATARAILRTWRAAGRRGARRAETPLGQAKRFADHQFAVLGQYLDSSLHTKKPGLPPPLPRIATPRPYLRLLCTIFASRSRAAQSQNYGTESVSSVVHTPVPAAFTLDWRPFATWGAAPPSPRRSDTQARLEMRASPDDPP